MGEEFNFESVHVSRSAKCRANSIKTERDSTHETVRPSTFRHLRDINSAVKVSGGEMIKLCDIATLI